MRCFQRIWHPRGEDRGETMSFEQLGYIELPENVKPGGFDHAAVHRASGKLYVAHPVNDALDVIDCVHDRYSHSIKIGRAHV